MEYKKIDKLLIKMKQEKNSSEHTLLGLEVANAILELFGVEKSELSYGEEALNKAFPNRKFKHQKMESWFHKHPYIQTARIALTLFSSKETFLEANFFRLSDSSSKARISASTQIGINWEDSELTKIPQYPVGIDFFLNKEGDSLLVVITNNGNLRVLELKDKLSNTQKEILDNLKKSYSNNLMNQNKFHQHLWDELALQTVNKKFYDGLVILFDELVTYLETNLELELTEQETKNNSRLFTTRLIGRLLFIWFLRKKSIICEDLSYFDIGDLSSTDYYEEKLKTLFFKTLNTPIEKRTTKDINTPYLNGGLFEPHENDWSNNIIKFPDYWFIKLYDHFNSFNFTTDESTSDYQQIAIDPEMLGRVFENLLATIIPQTSKTASEKKNKGTFYTPREIVDFMAKETLKSYLKKSHTIEIDFEGIDKLIDMNDAEYLEMRSTGAIKLWYNRSPQVIPVLIESLNELKVLDPSCGSGAFPIGMLQLIIKTYDRLGAKYDPNIKRHRVIKHKEKNNLYDTKLSVIRNNLFGVDIEPMAIEISKLRSWLSLIVDDDGEIDPLPNLDFNFVCANSLIPLGGNLQLSIFDDLEYEKNFEKLREKYFETHDLIEKNKLKLEFEEIYSSSNDFEIYTERTKLLKSWNPFESNKPALFFDPKTMFNIKEFDLIIGNPPYIGEKGNKEIFQKVRETSFGKKYYIGKMDYFYFFYHLGLDLVKDNGTISFITTNYFLTADGALKLRNDFKNRATFEMLINFGEVKVFKSALGQHNLISVLNKKKSTNEKVDVFHFQSDLINLENKPLREYMFDSSEVTYERVKNKKIYDGFNNYMRLELNSIYKNKLLNDILLKIKTEKNSLIDFCEINQGIVTGADKVTQNHKIKYNLNQKKGTGIFVINEKTISKNNLEKEFIFPWFKNSDIYKYKAKQHSERLIVYSTTELSEESNIVKYLEQFKQILLNRREVKNGRIKWYHLWWSRNKEIFNSEKIVAPQRSKTNTFAYVEKIPWYASADVYFITQKDEFTNLKYILAILNSKLMYFWLYNRGKRKGNMLELYSTPLSEIPIPEYDKIRDKPIIDNINKILKSDNDTEIERLSLELDDFIFKLYDLSEDDINIINNFIKTVEEESNE